MDTNTESLIKTAVNGFVQKGFMFTAYDVTKFLRKGGERISHNDVKDVVSSMFSNSELGQYSRDTVNVGAPLAPFLYFHPYSNMSDYSSDWIDNNPNQDGMRYDNGIVSTPTPVPANIPVSSVSRTKTPKVKLPDGIHKVTSEGRLNIPIDIVDSIFYARTIAHIYEGVNKLIVSPSNGLVISYLGAVKVNVDGRIRLSKHYLNGISNSDLFKISTDGVAGTIEVVPA